MKRIIFIGTSASVPTEYRNPPCIYVDLEKVRFLIDCGEGSQLNMIKKGVSFMKLDYIFISHAHGDHWYGILGLLDTMELYDREKDLKIFVPSDNYYFFQEIIPEYEWIEIIPYDELELDLGEFILKTFPLKHSIPTYGFYLKEKDKIKFKKEIMNNLPMEKRIEIVKNYQKYPEYWYIKKGIKICICPDTRPIINEYIRNCDILIHECTYSSEDYEKAIETFHTCAIELKNYKCKKYLYHISPRYKGKEEILEEESGGKVVNDMDEILLK